MRYVNYFETEPIDAFSGSWYSEWRDELERESVGTISDSNYIKWVQRSLNRLYNSDLAIDGTKSSKYKAMVRQFNNDYLYRDDDRVDEQTQNELIYLNSADGDYVEWLGKAINKAGFGPVAIARVLDTPLVNAIKAFQGKQRPKIKADGYVGAKTELALIKASGLYPPGKPRPKPTVKPTP